MEVSEEKISDLARQIYMGLTEEERKRLTIDVGKEVEKTKIINEVDIKDITADVSVLDRSNSLSCLQEFAVAGVSLQRRYKRAGLRLKRLSRRRVARRIRRPHGESPAAGCPRLLGRPRVLAAIPGKSG